MKHDRTFILILLFSVLIPACNQDHSQEPKFNPVIVGPQLFWPDHVSIEWETAVPNHQLIELSDEGTILWFADKLIYNTQSQPELLLKYDDGVYSLDPCEGWMVRALGDNIAYVGADKHSIVLYDIETCEYEEHSVDKEIWWLDGTSTLYAFGQDEDETDYELYMLNESDGLMNLGTIPFVHFLSEKNREVIGEDLFLCYAGILYKCDSTGINQLIDLNQHAEIDYSFSRSLRIAEYYHGESNFFLLKNLLDYYVVKVTGDNASVVGEFDDLYTSPGNPHIILDIDGFYLCTDGQIQKRNFDNGLLEVIADVPDHTATYRTTGGYTIDEPIPHNMVQYFMKDDQGNFLIISPEGLLIISSDGKEMFRHPATDFGIDEISGCYFNPTRIILVSTDNKAVLIG